MAVITISQGSHSGGRMLGEAVARRLGYRCIHREQVISKAAQWGVSEDDLRIALEKPPKFFGQSQHTKYLYLAFIQAALVDEVRDGNAVYTGLAGHILLGKGPHVLRTRLIAPMPFRIAMVEERRNLGRKEAIAYIEKVDDDRRKWTRFLYGVDWSDESLYDLVVNLDQMTLVEACDVICSLSRTGCFQATPETLRDLENLALASRVKAHLAMEHDTSNVEFDVKAQGGTVTIKGGIDGPTQAKKVRAIAENIPGVQHASVKELALVNRL